MSDDRSKRENYCAISILPLLVKSSRKKFLINFVVIHLEIHFFLNFNLGFDPNAQLRLCFFKCVTNNKKWSTPGINSWSVDVPIIY